MFFFTQPDYFYAQTCTLGSSMLLIIQIIGMADDCKGGLKKSSLEKEHETIYGDNVLLHILTLCTIYAHGQFKISFLAHMSS